MGREKREVPHMGLALVIKSLISSLCESAINPWIIIFISLNGSFSSPTLHVCVIVYVPVLNTR